jgi:hypothetical protein
MSPLPPASFDGAREELEAVLASHLFTRAPSLKRMLRFLCERTLLGDVASIKEYTVAVEALGRPKDFNPKRDPIVRVEAYRLRKRLAAYYAAEGASHPVRITLEPGQYIPRFETAAPQREIPLPPPAATGQPWRSPLLAAAAALLLTLALWPLASTWSTHVRAASLHPDTATDGIHLLAGISAGQAVDPEGNFWSHDAFFHGGTAVTRSGVPADFSSPARFWTERRGDFSYDIPLKPGAYQLRLSFSPPPRASGALPGFRVLLNETPLMDRLDPPPAPCDPATPVERVFSNVHPSPDGQLHLHFQPVSSPAWVNAIEIVPQPGSQPIPIRLLAKSSPYIDAAGRLWSSDRHFCGGTLVNRHQSVVAPNTDPNLFSGERWGAFAYQIPAAPGCYRLTLRFSESWFGPTLAGLGGAGSRIFDVFLAGRPLIRNLDVFSTAGGSLRPVELSFPHLQPNPAGQIFLQFIPQKNFAMINAIELVPESD